MTQDTTPFAQFLQPRPFVILCAVMAIAGVAIGIIAHIVFDPYHLTLFQGIQIVFVLIVVCTAIAVTLHKIREKMQDPEAFLDSFKPQQEDDE